MPQLPPPKACISFDEFTQRIKNLALNKFLNIAIQEVSESQQLLQLLIIYFLLMKYL